MNSVIALSAVFGLDLDKYFLVLAVCLGCIVAAEIVGISVLIAKIRRARLDPRAESAREDRRFGMHGFAAFLAGLFGTEATAAAATLAILALVALLGAIAFAILLIVCCTKGYLFASAEDVASVDARNAAEQADRAAARREYRDEPTPAEPAEEPYRDEAEDETYDPYEEEQPEPTANAAMDAGESDGGDLRVELPQNEEEYTEENTDGVIGQPSVTPSAAPVAGHTKIVEREVREKSETVTRVVQVPAGITLNSPASEELLRALAEFVKLEKELRVNHREQVLSATDADREIPEETDDDLVDEREDEEESDASALGSEEEDTFDAEDDEGDGEHFAGNERVIGFDAETNCYLIAHYRRSLEANLIQAKPQVKESYGKLRNALTAYEDIKERMSWTTDTYSTADHTKIARIRVRERSLDLYLALDPATLEDSVYHGKDVGDKKKFADTPFRFRINSARKIQLALELVRRTAEEAGLSPIDVEEIDCTALYPFDTTENLVKRGLIKEYIREEQRAATFELDADRVLDLPTADDSVIPANANFTFELDDSAPAKEEETPAPTAEVEEPQPAQTEAIPVVAEQPMATTETITVTERFTAERTVETNFPTTAEAAEETTESPVIEVVPEEETEEEPEEEIVEEEPEEEPEEETEEEIEEEPEEIVEEEPEEEPEEETEEEPEEEPEEETEEEPEEETEEEPEEEPEEESEEETEEESEEEIEEESEEEAEEEIEEEPEEKPAPKVVAPPPSSDDPSVLWLDICMVEGLFAEGDTINLEALKAKGIADDCVTNLKITASKALHKRFTVEANRFDMAALRSIGAVDGDCVKLM